MAGVFTKNTIFTFLTRGFSFVFSFLAAVIIARALGPEGKGFYSLAILLATLLMTFFDFGISPAVAFYTGKQKYPLNQIFGNNLILSFFIGLIAILAGVVIAFPFHKVFFAGVEQEHLILAVLSLPFSLFFYFVSSIFLGKQLIKDYNLASIFSGVFLLISTAVLLVILKAGVSGAILGFTFSFVFADVWLFCTVKKRCRGISFKINKDYFKDISSYGIKFHLSNIFAFFHSQTNLLLLNVFFNPAAVGFFSIANELTTKLQLLPQSAATVLFPKIVAEGDENYKKEFTSLVCRNTIFITSALVIFLFFFSRLMITAFFSEKFLDSVAPFQILLPSAIALSGSQILTTDFLGRGLPMLNTYSNAVAFFLNIVLSIFLIPRFALAGAAWAMTISYLILFLVKALIYKKISGNRIKDLFFPKKTDFQLYSLLFKNFVSFLKTQATKTII